jgi:hypothetical protein
MKKNTTKSVDHHNKSVVQNIKNPFLKLMKWIESARKNNVACKG